ncbi:MAG: XkdF-like putative serine protease domain-containing protein [Actinomycetota bacterium]
MSVSIDQIRTEIARRFRPGDSEEDGWAWVREMFTDRAIVEIEPAEAEREIQLVEVSWSIAEDAEDASEVALGTPREVELEYVAKAEGGPRLAGPWVGKDATRQIGYSAVLVPGEPDADGETLTAEKVEDVAHTWLEQFRAFDVQHSVKQVDVVPVESYLEPADRTVQIDGEDVVLPAGTWTVAVKARDAQVWEEIASGKRSGLSIMGVPNDQLEQALAAVKAGQTPAIKRVTLADVGGGDANGDWFAPFIGIVDQPAVPKAKFYAFKQAAPKRSLARRVADALTGGAAKGRQPPQETDLGPQEAGEAIAAVLAAADHTRADSAHDHQKEVPVTPAEIQEVAGAVKSALGLGEGDTLDSKIETAVKEQLAEASGADGGGQATNGDGGAGSEGEGSELSEATVKAITDAVAEAIKPVAEKADRAEQRTRPGSRQPGDPDPDPDPEPALKGVPSRDPFGRALDA